MEENKNLTPETEKAAETSAAEKKLKFGKKENKSKKIRNQAIWRKGGFSLAITAAVLVGIIIFNVLVTALADRFVLEFDMSIEKQNTVNEENIEFLKGVDAGIEILVCAKKDDYTGGYMARYAQQYNVTEDAGDYYKQTVNLLDKYTAYNKKITLRYIDTQSAEFTEITTRYSNAQINYGDVIVVNKDNRSRYKIVGYEDIYLLADDDTYASYGYTTSTVVGNKVETAITSAIAYVTSEKPKKALMIMGHSKIDYTESYQSLLETNNYDITVTSDKMVGNISDDFDAVIIPAPNSDFLEGEINSMATFLDNNGKYGKGLIFIADASAPYLPNFYDFLSEWGIAVDEGILYETSGKYHLDGDPTTMYSLPLSGVDDPIINGINYCVTGYNVPIYPAFESEGQIKVSSLTSTPETVVAAPVGTTAGWEGADSYEKKAYSTVLQSEMSTYDSDNNRIASYVYALSSVEFISSSYSEMDAVSNKNICYAIAERAVGAEDTGISFISKTITDESFTDKVTNADTNVVRVIFMAVLPLVCIVAGIYIFIRRKNA